MVVRAVWEGLKQLPYKSTYLWASLANCVTASFVFAYRPPQFISHYFANNDWPLWIQRFYALPEYAKARTWLYLILTAIIYPILVGGVIKWQFKVFQKKLDVLKFGGDTNRPQVIRVTHDEDSKTTVRIKSVGIGVEKFQGRKGDLQSAFNQTVESIVADENSPQYIDVILSSFPLPKLLRFEDHADKLVEEGQFLIGQSRQGFLVQKITDLPHLLMAGTSGSGKSTFFKQAIFGLLKSSPKAKFYLMDLKQGAEFGVFAKIPGVKFAKTVEPSLKLLREVKTEMMARFEQMEQRGITKFDPEKDNLPRIIVAIDEASEILAIPHRNNPLKDDIIECRNLVNDIAKLGRAAAVNLMIATQKVSKTIIDTSLQENMGGRLAFRMATLANSAQVLGSKDAREIPAIDGRGRYQFGTKSLDIQAPYLPDEKLKEKVKEIAKIRAEFISTDQPVAETKSSPMLRDKEKKEFNAQEPDTESASPV